MRDRPVPWLVLTALLALAIGVLISTLAAGTPVTANQTSSAELSFGVLAAPNVACNSPDTPDACTVEPGTQFTLSIDTHALPLEGFSGFTVVAAHPGLTSKDIRYVVPDFTTFGVTGLGTDSFLVGGVTSISPPVPLSTYLGPLVEADLNCPIFSGTFNVSIPIPATPQESGTQLQNPFGQEIPLTTVQQDSNKVADTLTINCATKLPYPGDTDGDGCADERENLPKAQAEQGGGRDFTYPYDYFDVSIPRDGVIDLSNDILGVILHYAPGGTEPEYDVNYDRGPTTGPHAWNMAPPDGVIDLSNDILGVIQQYQNNC